MESRRAYIIFPSVKLRPQTPQIDKRDVGDCTAIPGVSRI